MLSTLVVFFFFFKQKTAYEMLRSLVGSEMCIRDREKDARIAALQRERDERAVGEEQAKQELERSQAEAADKITQLEGRLTDMVSSEEARAKDKEISFLQAEVNKLKDSVMDTTTMAEEAMEHSNDAEAVMAMQAEIEGSSKRIEHLQGQLDELEKEKSARVKAESKVAEKAQEVAVLEAQLAAIGSQNLENNERVPAEKVGFLAKVFAIFDRDGNHYIDEDELLEIGTFVWGESWTRAMCSDMFEKVDRDKDGKITLEEFIAGHELTRDLLEGFTGDDFDTTMKDEHIMVAMDRARQEVLRKMKRHKQRTHRMKEIFDKFDVDGDGRLSHKELYGVGMALHAEEKLGWTKDRNQRLMKLIDTDGTGFIEIEEFLHYYKSVIYDVSDERFEIGLKTFANVEVRDHAAEDGSLFQYDRHE
eukprot:TRINITY_DN4971_c0_g1_i2.p1 TRINITY_DN4971_c0_g1~~TRINITY_DN4971_c0_g1_i2.p1  ORF type:complete len:419 (+),score=179.62 TRINITY_DN4971_c0_g1_i2:71-1327(+)